MAISVQDLDQLLGYDPATHSVAGIPSMKSAQPSIPARGAMSPVQQSNMDFDMARSGRMATQPTIPKAAAPGAAPTAPEIPSASAPSVGGSIPARPTPQQSITAGMAENGTTAKQEGKNEWQQMRPQSPEELGIKPLTPEYFQQQRAQADYDKAHPLGGDISAKPGFWGKLEHGLAKAGNIAGDIVAPGTMALIPGTDLNKQEERGAQMRGFNTATEAQEREAQTGNIEAETAERSANANAWKPMGEPKQDPTNGQWFQAGAQRDPSGQVTESFRPLNGGPTNTPDPTKQPVGEQGATQLSAELGTLTAGMAPDEAKKFTEAYGVRPNDTGAVAEKRLADAKAAAQMTGAERDRKIQMDATAAQREFTNKIAEGTLAVKQAGEGKGGTDVVRGYDKDGVPHLTSEADAKAQGFTKLTKATDKDIDSARTHNVVLNDMQAKLNDVVHDSGALNQNEGQRAIIAKALSDEKNTTFQSLLTSGVLSQASEPTKAYIQSVLSLRESALGLPKEITGGSRVSEVQSSALWATLPSAGSLDSKYALSQAKKFQANIDRLWQRVDSVEGMTHEQPAEELAAPKRTAAAGGAPSKVLSPAEWAAQHGG